MLREEMPHPAFNFDEDEPEGKPYGGLESELTPESGYRPEKESKLTDWELAALAVKALGDEGFRWGDPTEKTTLVTPDGPFFTVRPGEDGVLPQYVRSALETRLKNEKGS